MTKGQIKVTWLLTAHNLKWDMFLVMERKSHAGYSLILDLTFDDLERPDQGHIKSNRPL
jgi:hypothetical protein